MQPSFAETVRQRAEELTPSERRLVSSVLDAPRSAALASVTEMARGAGVHGATVSRLARKLGFEGYGAFRQALQDEFIPSRDTARRIRHTIDASGGGVLASLLEREAEALQRLARHVTEADVARAARTLMAARRVYVFASGNAEVLAHLMAKRLGRYGRDVHLLMGSARDLAEGALGMGPRDVLLVFAFRRVPRRYAAIMGHATEVGAGTMAIAGTTGALLVPAPGQLLSAPRGGDAEGFQTLTVPMAICNAIVIAAGAYGADGADDGQAGRALRSLDALGELIRRFE